MKLAVGSDHAGFQLKSKLVPWLRSKAGGRHTVRDMGCTSPDPCDYPDYAAAVARQVSQGRCARGILLCGTGIGMAIAANKVHGIRAAVCWNSATSALAAEHNKANVLCLPARLLGSRPAKAIVQTFLSTSFGGGRHGRRVRKISTLDRCA